MKRTPGELAQTVQQSGIVMPQMRLGDADINYRDAGAGHPVILLHSSSSHSGQWKPLMDVAGDRYRFVAPDLHGYGRSGALPDDGRPCFEHDVAIVDRLIDVIGAPVHLVGHSLGGTIAARVALRRPELVASLTLIEPVLFCLLEETGDTARTEYLDLAHAMVVLIGFGDRERAAELFLDYWVGRGALQDLDAATRDYVIGTIGRVADDWRGISMHTPGQVRIRDFESLGPAVHLMCASQTKPAARAIVDHLRRVIPNPAYSEIPGAGHMAPASHPDAVNPIILAFLDRRTGSRPG